MRYLDVGGEALGVDYSPVPLEPTVATKLQHAELRQRCGWQPLKKLVVSRGTPVPTLISERSGRAIASRSLILRHSQFTSDVLPVPNDPSKA